MIMDLLHTTLKHSTLKYIVIYTLGYILNCAEAQTTNTSIFTFADFPPTIPDSTVKIFTTSLTLIPNNVTQTEFDQGVFINATTEFYSSKFSGFTSMTMINNSTNNSTNEIAVSYEVRYNYTTFVAGGASESSIRSEIESLSSVKTGLESIAEFVALYNVSSNQTTFSFSSNSICPAIDCGTSYLECSESSFGLSPTCRSICFSTFTCENDGVCVHRSTDLSPNCNCIASATVWYIGGHCEYKVEVWMIVVFIIGFLLLIFLIILIGWCCCRKSTLRRQKQYTTPVRPKSTLQNSGNAKNTSNRQANKKMTSSRNHTENNEQQSAIANEESDIGAFGSPVTSAALVTVQESSSESDISTQTPNFFPEPPDSKQAIQPTATTLVQNAPAAVQESDQESSDSSSDESELPRASTTSPSSVSDNQTQRYDSLQFPDTHRHNDTEEYAKLTLV